MTLRRRNTVPPNMLLSSIASWGDGVMAPPFLPLRHYAPSQVTEDTPPDLLEGTMDLEVTLPNGQTVVMSVHRSTPMMDLLIQVTTAHRINPGGHVIQVISDNIFLTYKPSTPIGTLDTNAIKIVSKNTLNEMSKARKSNLQQQAIERNIRLKPKEWVYKQQLVVNLPRNQLAVYRVPPKSLISEIFSMVCEDKNLDPEAHEIRHPVNVDERLRGSCSLSDYQLQEVCVVSSDFRPPPLSVTDLITMSSIAHPEDKKRRGIFGIFSRKAKSSTGDSSVSSGSAGERSVSPARSDESVEGRPSSQAQSPTSSSATLTNVYSKSNASGNVTVSSIDRSSNGSDSTRISRPVSMISLNKTKKRLAPVPPQRIKRTIDEQQAVNETVNGNEEKTNLSRHNSDSSGYHEQDRKSQHTSPSCSEVGSIEANRLVLRPASNLTSVSNSSSTTSVKAGKRKAPSPPRPIIRNGRTSPSSIPESPEGIETKQTLEVCEETAANVDSSQVSVTECSVNLTNENIDQDDSLKVDSSQKNVSENSLSNLENMSESTSNVSKLQTVDKVHTMQDGNQENSLSSKTSSATAEVIVEEENHSEILKVSLVELSVEKPALESTESPVVANSSSSPPLVASESEVNTRTVGLSSETSCTSIEMMMNPKDIQRPKRHRRKKIPEVFMRNSVSTDSFVSNDSAHVARYDHSNDVSMSLQQPKYFENVQKEGEEEIVVPPKNIDSYYGEGACNDGFEEMVPTIDAQSDLKIVNERLKEEENSSKEVPKDSHSDCSNTNAQLSVVYIEDLNEEESTTDPLTPPTSKKKYTTTLQVSTEEQMLSTLNDENDNIRLQPLSTTESNTTITNENGSKQFSKSCREEIIAELKSTLENPDENSDHRPRILTLKQKEKRDWDFEKPSEYNLILNVNKKGKSSYSSDSPFASSASVSSYESFDMNALKKSRSSTETSYESVPPPLPESQIPLPSDSDSKASSILSRQSSFSDHETVEFTKPSAPAFSISTYESRASKISYNKKLSRSESLASFKDIQSNDLSHSDDRKLNRSDSQRNEVFRSDNLKKKCTSTTFLNLSSNKDEKEEEKISFNSNVRPSLIKSRSRPSLLEIGTSSSDINDMSKTIEFEVSSSKEPITFTHPLPFKTYNNLRKAKSQLDISNDNNRMAEGYQGIPDSGLANEYMRLQDDFVKWQQQLLQNQQLLHNRVAPIAANPPVVNNVGLVSNMLNQSSPAPQQQPQQQQARKPVEITIPIRLVDSDDEDDIKMTQPQTQTQPKLVSNPTPQRNTQVNTPAGFRRNGPNVSIDSWQERPNCVVITQPTVIEPSAPRPFVNQPRMQTVFQSTPNDWQDRETVLEKPSFQQKPQATLQGQQNTVTYPQQNPSMPEFYQVQRQQQNTPAAHPQQTVSRPEFYQVNQPQSNSTQEPQPHFRQLPNTNFQGVPLQNHLRNENPQEKLQEFELHQPVYPQTQIYNSNSLPESNSIKFSEQNSPFVGRYPQNINRPQQAVCPPVVDKGEEGINARFSSVVTLSNDKNDQNFPQKDKVRSVVQLNNSSPQVGQNSLPFHSNIISAANKDVNNKEGDGPLSFQPSNSSSVAPMSSRLVQQAVQQPNGGSRISPPKVELRYSPPKFEQRSSPPRIERQYQAPPTERQPSPLISEPSLPFGEVKLRHVESPRVSPPKTITPEPLVAPPPPPPPLPPSKVNAGAPAPPPPPPPAMSEADRRAATGKKILGAAYTPQLDAREELMMAIRQFGGSQNLRKSQFAPPH